jgi:alkylhydroperoxidase family enzyme
MLLPGPLKRSVAVSSRAQNQPRHARPRFDDTGILDICQVVSYFNYVNRLADGLGVELEDF